MYFCWYMKGGSFWQSKNEFWTNICMRERFPCEKMIDLSQQVLDQNAILTAERAAQVFFCKKKILVKIKNNYGNLIYCFYIMLKHPPFSPRCTPDSHLPSGSAELIDWRNSVCPRGWVPAPCARCDLVSRPDSGSLRAPCRSRIEFWNMWSPHILYSNPY